MSERVAVCENWRTCTTKPVPLQYVDPNEPPVCDENLYMTTVIEQRDWMHHAWRQSAGTS